MWIKVQAVLYWNVQVEDVFFGLIDWVYVFFYDYFIVWCGVMFDKVFEDIVQGGDFLFGFNVFCQAWLYCENFFCICIQLVGIFIQNCRFFWFFYCIFCYVQVGQYIMDIGKFGVNMFFLKSIGIVDFQCDSMYV